MSGECNWCGGEHAEDACDARRELVYENGRRSGYADGWNDRNKGVTLGREVVEKVREALAKIAAPDCKTPVPVGGGTHYVTREMACDAGQPEREGEPIEHEPDWVRCGECAACIANQALALLPKDSPHA